MSQDLAKEFFSYFGGNIVVCCEAAVGKQKEWF